MRPCTCDQVTGPVYSNDQCRRCWKWHYDPIYRSKLSPQPPVEWTPTRRLIEDAILLAAKLPPYVSAIAGIPRSGMMVASAIATHLHLPLYCLPYGGKLQPAGSGGRAGFGWAGVPDGPIVVIDDTVYMGTAMARARQQMGARSALFAAVYVTPWTLDKVDFYTRTLPSIQLLEWNIFNNGLMRGTSADNTYRGGCATDMDGILCEEPTAPDSDTEGYERFLREAKPRWLPRALAIPLIVTGRLEKYRAVTEEWLSKWGVRYDRLIMSPARSWQERGDIAQMKAAAYAGSQCGFFFESDPDQAARIFAAVKRPVICPPAERVWMT